jgi:hypothetical protein
MKKGLFLRMLALAGVSTVQAQRFTDDLKRGLVAVPTGSSGNSTTNFVSWRKLADEYYDVTYNLYKDGKKVASGLNVTCYNDGSNAYPTTYYKVAAVVNGVEQAKCDSVTPWTQDVYKLGDHRFCTGYIDIPLDTVYDRAGNDVTVNYEANDAEVADLDGDGEMEIIIKRLNTVDASISEKYGEMYSVKSKEFVVLDAYDVNWQTGKASKKQHSMKKLAYIVPSITVFKMKPSVILAGSIEEVQNPDEVGVGNDTETEGIIEGNARRRKFWDEEDEEELY